MKKIWLGLTLLIGVLSFSEKAESCGCRLEGSGLCDQDENCGCFWYNPMGQQPSCADRVEITPGSGYVCKPADNKKECDLPGTKSVCYRTKACTNGSTHWPSFCYSDGSCGLGVAVACVQCSGSGISNPWSYYDKRCI